MRKKLSAVVSLFALTLIPFLHGESASEIDTARKCQNAFNRVAEKAFPAVVVITTRKEMDRRMAPIIRYFGGRRGVYEFNAPVIEGKGSGFFVSDDGFVLTNYHVIRDNDEIIVKTKSGEQYRAETRGVDPRTDLALLKISAEGKLPFLEFADSDKVLIGDWAIAVGAPYNFDYTMTVGVVSQTGRSVGLNTYENYIQTDAAINRGNSGGPLLDIDGKVIGVSDFIFTDGLSAGNIGLGFAIPSNIAKNVVSQLKNKGNVARPWIGIAMDELSPEMKKYMKVSSGVLVRQVFAENPADKAGIEPGDVILQIDGTDVATPRDVQNRIFGKAEGAQLVIKILRNGKNMDITVLPKMVEQRENDPQE